MIFWLISAKKIFALRQLYPVTNTGVPLNCQLGVLLLIDHWPV